MGEKRRKQRELLREERRTLAAGSSLALVGDSSTSSAGSLKSLGAFLLGIVLGSAIVFGVGAKRKGASSINDTSASAKGAKEQPIAEIPDINHLVSLTGEELARVSLERINLACAKGLPGANQLPAEALLKELERFAELVKKETARNYHRFLERPQEYQNSEEFFKVGLMNTVLGLDLGVHYNKDKIVEPTLESMMDKSFYDNSDDVFLTGLLGEKRMGTCSSMPVLLVALGRRLGYPLKLVSAKGHLFLRWDDGTTKVNFECTNGIAIKPDEFYRQWPFPVSEEEVQAGWYLASMTPRQELAAFFADTSGSVALAWVPPGSLAGQRSVESA